MQGCSHLNFHRRGRLSSCGPKVKSSLHLMPVVDNPAFFHHCSEEPSLLSCLWQRATGFVGTFLPLATCKRGQAPYRLLNICSFPLWVALVLETLVKELIKRLLENDMLSCLQASVLLTSSAWNTFSLLFGPQPDHPNRGWKPCFVLPNTLTFLPTQHSWHYIVTAVLLIRTLTSHNKLPG